MKKNAMLKIAAILMVAVLLTTCAISSTFAKYVTTGSANSTGARVAKFGVILDTKIVTDAFKTVYTTDNEEYSDTITNSVQAAAEVVAPGTSGSLTYSGAITGDGTAEVAVLVKSTPVFTLTGFSDDYCPIYFTVGSTVYKHTALGGTYSKTSDLVAALNGAIAITEEYQPGTSFADDLAEKTVSWAWDFEVLDADGEVDAEIDELDTALGNAGTASIAFSLTQSVTQID